MRLLLASLMTALAVSVAVPAGAVVKTTLDQEQRDVLQKAEAHLSDVETMKARFLQVTSQGGTAEGSVAMLRPGRMRLEYDEPTPVLIVADGRWLIYVDKELDQVSHIGLGSTPAGILLRKNVSFEDRDIAVTGVRRAKGVAEIDVSMIDDPGAGTLTLVFAEDPFELRQWRIRDAQGVETTVSLFDVKTGVPLDKRQFSYTVLPKSKGNR